MTTTTLWTFQDAVEHLLDTFGAEERDARPLRWAKRAVLTAYRDLPGVHRWSYYDRTVSMLTEASQSTGTIVYDHTGGSNEREVTLTGATWPANAAFGRLIISGIHYRIDSRVSDTVITLSPNNNPGADVAAGTTYIYYRSTYPLPVNFRKLGVLYDPENDSEISIISTDDLHQARIQVFGSPSTPHEASLRNHGEYYNSLSLDFGPPPESARQYALTYESAPRKLIIEKYSTGTVTITGGTTAVSGNATVFPADCVGSVIRFSADGTNEPTSVIGDVAGIDNLPDSERTIIARGGDTSLTIDSSVASTLTTVKYTISDPVDVEEHAMWSAFLKMAEAEYARLQLRKDAQDRAAEALFAIKLAKENDQRSLYSRGRSPRGTFDNTTIVDSA